MYLLKAVPPRDAEVCLAVKVDDGEQLVERVGVGRAEALHHLQRLLLVGLMYGVGCVSVSISILPNDILSLHKIMLYSLLQPTNPEIVN